MNSKRPATPKTREDLEQMPKSVLVELVLQQPKFLEELITKVERLQGQLDKDSQTSSKPPSSDPIKRSEKKPASDSNSSETSKRQPGGQPGHKGKTRKGFGRIDRYEVVEPSACELCGGNHFEMSGTSSRCYVVAQLVERPIEIVEYRQVRRVCGHCGTQTAGELPAKIIPGLDLSTNLQEMLAWLGHYGHLSYAKQQEWLREFGKIVSRERSRGDRVFRVRALGGGTGALR